MNSEALIGTKLGTCTLLQQIGQGTMGTVYLAQQSRPHRQVAVKVLLRASTLEPAHLADFLERFRHEVDAAASLEHPHILSIHEYSEHDGLAYLVMPYISGGTLQNMMEREDALPFAIVVKYLEQLSAALDFAHERGIMHHDIKPSNVLITPEDRLLLTDFGLTKVLSDEKTAQVRLVGSGMLDYMAPEQVLGKKVDARADLYSLGAILYRMVTGTAPFQGETLMQVAVKHLQMPPPSPRSLRPDLPIAAEQVMLRALAKRPANRYAHAQDLATTFRLALTAAEVQLDDLHDGTILSSHPNKLHDYIPHGLFDPKWQKAIVPAVNDEPSHSQSMVEAPLAGKLSGGQSSRQVGTRTETPQGGEARFTSPPDRVSDAPTPGARPAHPPTTNAHTLYKKHTLHPTSKKQPALPVSPKVDPITPAPETISAAPTEATLIQSTKTVSASVATEVQPKDPSSAHTDAQAAQGDRKGSLLQVHVKETSSTQTDAQAPVKSAEVRPAEPSSAITDAQSPVKPIEYTSNPPLLENKTTDALALTSNEPGNTGTIKLTGLARVVRLPIAGQPGQYVTGLLPVLPAAQLKEEKPSGKAKTHSSKRMKTPGLVLLVMLIVLGSGTFWLIRSHLSATKGHKGASIAGTPNLGATATAHAIATVNANIILTDPLSRNIYNWPVISSGSKIYTFEDGAYHIINNDNALGAPALLPNEVFGQTFGYSLTMQEIRGDDTSINNEFGIMIRANTVNKDGKTITTFYSFEVQNMKGGQYQFWKYDNTQGPTVNPWKELWSHAFGGEFHEGHGPKSINTLKIFANGKSFTLIVNGKQIGTVQDSSCSGCPCNCSGGVGMLVNQKGTEVAFSNLVLTKD